MLHGSAVMTRRWGSGGLCTMIEPAQYSLPSGSQRVTALSQAEYTHPLPKIPPRLHNANASAPSPESYHLNQIWWEKGCLGVLVYAQVVSLCRPVKPDTGPVP